MSRATASTYAQRSANASRFILLRFLSLRQKPTRADICVRAGVRVGACAPGPQPAEMMPREEPVQPSHRGGPCTRRWFPPTRLHALHPMTDRQTEYFNDVTEHEPKEKVKQVGSTGSSLQHVHCFGSGCSPLGCPAPTCPGGPTPVLTDTSPSSPRRDASTKSVRQASPSILVPHWGEFLKKKNIKKKKF